MVPTELNVRNSHSRTVVRAGDQSASRSLNRRR
jgi:hypothetical protein